jgi:hypothetical protein
MQSYGIWEQINKVEDKIEELENKPNYDPSNPSQRLISNREQLAV